MDVTADEIRALVNRDTDGTPVTSVYLNTDGAQLPRAADYEARLDGLLRDVRATAEGLSEAHGKAVQADAEAINRWVRDEFERGDVRGLALFSSGGELFERAEVAESVRNIARVQDSPYVVPLQVLLGRHSHIALAIIQRDRTRVLRYQLGRLEEYLEVESDVHGQHDQGGWSQARYQRGIAHEVLHHMKDTDDVLLKLHESQPIEALVVGGAHVEATDFAKSLHPWLQEVLHGEPLSLDANAGHDEIMERLAQVEQELVSERRSGLLQRLAAGQGQAEKDARGLRAVIEATNEKRVEVLFVVEGAGEPGYQSETGALALHESEAAAYGGAVRRVPDVIDEIIEEAVKARAHIELFRDPVRLDGHPVAALLRF